MPCLNERLSDVVGGDVLEVWYSRLDDADFLALVPAERKAALRKRIAKATAHTSSELVFPKLVEQAGSEHHIRDTPPTIFHPETSRAAGWVTGPEGRQFYIRQLRDVKLRPLVETYDAEMLSVYAKACGWVLARAHAKSGDPWAISGYLGKADDFDEAMGRFALAYADQAERDHAALKAAVRAGVIDVQMEG